MRGGEGAGGAYLHEDVDALGCVFVVVRDDSFEDGQEAFEGEGFASCEFRPHVRLKKAINPKVSLCRTPVKKHEPWSVKSPVSSRAPSLPSCPSSRSPHRS